jgi:hypothetical protein
VAAGCISDAGDGGGEGRGGHGGAGARGVGAVLPPLLTAAAAATMAVPAAAKRASGFCSLPAHNALSRQDFVAEAVASRKPVGSWGLFFGLADKR